MESYPSDLAIQTVIKTEQLEPEESIDEQSLLVPLYEEPIKQESNFNCPDDFPFVKCKEEPEVHIEEITAMPLSIEQPQRKAKKRKARDSGEETDSAPERLELKSERSNKRSIRTWRSHWKNVENIETIAPKSERAKTNKKIQRSMARKKRTKIRSTTDKSKDAAIPVKISEAKALMKEWPMLTVDLIDIDKKT